MTRTKKTAQILRQLELEASSSSSSSNSDENSVNGDANMEPVDDDVIDNGDIPPAQSTNVDNTTDDDETNTREHASIDEDVGVVKSEKEGTSSTDGDQSHDDAEAGASGSDEGSSGFGTSGSRKRPLTACEEAQHYVPPLKTSHKTWDKFERYLKKYQRDTLNVLAISETENVRIRNKKIAKLKIQAAKSPSELPVVPEQCDPYQCVYICTHGWRPRSRSKGKRTLHNVNGVGCQMQFRAQYVKNANDQWRIQIKNAFYGHCHTVSQEVYRNYPSARQVPKEAPVMKDVELMVTSGSKASRIYDYIRERSPHYVQLKDVHNLIAKIKNQGECKAARIDRSTCEGSANTRALVHWL